MFPIESGECTGDGKEEEEESKGDDVTPRAEEGDNQGPGADNQETETVVEALLLHGGMDTEGEIFDDTLIFLLD